MLKNNSIYIDIGKILIGSILFAISLNCFLIPSNVYSAGFMGIAQLLRDLVQFLLNINFSFDIAGIINFNLNIFVICFAYKYISKKFALMTILTIGMQSTMLTLIPAENNLLSDPLVSIIFGSILCAIATVIIFDGNGSGGGIDVVGIYLSQNNKGSIGKVYMLVNTSIYLICLIFYNFETAVYSMISSMILSLVVDKIHKKNIEVELMIFTEKSNEVKELLLMSYKRGTTCWKGYGGFTKDGKEILLSVVTKNQANEIIAAVRNKDPNSFVISSMNIQVHGNFKKSIIM